VLLSGCGITDTGSKCGGAQSAFARVVLPDTGIAAADTVFVGLSQFDPIMIGESTDLSVQHVWRPERGPNPGPDPRVRLVRDDGRVLLDTLADRRVPFQAVNDTRGTWIVIKRFSDAGLRQLLFEAIRDSTLSLELRPRTGDAAGSRVRLQTLSAEVSPIGFCL
jgi:hypothetical protein